jgi:hypothetical protein
MMDHTESTIAADETVEENRGARIAMVVVALWRVHHRYRKWARTGVSIVTECKTSSRSLVGWWKQEMLLFGIVKCRLIY